ncbi:hypothetical protein PULV_a2936 [Pseudoalteromonas ulvae UL12]|nr:hypothetical protein [Pseudoalteromonas ulvae UL12]
MGLDLIRLNSRLLIAKRFILCGFYLSIHEYLELSNKPTA